MAIKRDPSGKFLPGSGGRVPGARNRLQASFVDAMQKDFEENGIDVIKIVRVEKPTEYLKILAGILPKEMLFSGDVLEEMTDDELKEAIATLRRLKVAA
jgi:hypothetical protein